MAQSSAQLSNRPPKRAIDGVLLLDKPCGPSSNQALQQARRRFGAQKAGHGGTLDPLATGLLPICFGEATKFSSLLLDSDKKYAVRVQLGATTTTGDAEGAVTHRATVPPLTREVVELLLQGFCGDIWQTPPTYSALKQQGERLCDRARRGETVVVAPRQVTIFALQLDELGTDYLDCTVHCGKGTYIRSLAVDLGAALGCGGFVAQLRRLAVAPFTEPMVTLAQLDAATDDALLDFLLPCDSALRHWPVVTVTADAAHSLLQGQPLPVTAAPATPAGQVRLYDAQRFLGIGEYRGGRLWPKRLVNPPLTADSPQFS